MPSPGSITALLEHLQAGDHEAAQPLWERYYPRLVGLARERLRGTLRPTPRSSPRFGRTHKRKSTTPKERGTKSETNATWK
jgi:hypothetical protein